MKKLPPLVLAILMLSGCWTGVFRYYNVEGVLRSQQGSTPISIRATRYSPQIQYYSIPGFLTVNAEANGLLVEMRNSDSTRRLEITNLSAHHILSPENEVPIEIPYQQLRSEHTPDKDVHYAFLKMTDYTGSMELGSYAIRLLFEANGVQNVAIFDLNYIVHRQLETRSVIPNYN